MIARIFWKLSGVNDLTVQQPPDRVTSGLSQSPWDPSRWSGNALNPCVVFPCPIAHVDGQRIVGTMTTAQQGKQVGSFVSGEVNMNTSSKLFVYGLGILALVLALLQAGCRI